MRLLGRYVFREILTSAVLGTLLATFIIFLREVNKLFALLLGAGNPGIRTILELFLLSLPPVLPMTIPFGTLVGILIGLGRMSGDGEIVAMRAAGVSSRRVIAPVLVFAALGTGLAAFASLRLTPLALRTSTDILNELAKAQLSAEIPPRIFNEDFPNKIIYVGNVVQVGSTTEWRNLFVADVTPPEKRTNGLGQKASGPLITVAQSAIVTSDPRNNRLQLSLKNYSTHEMGKDGKAQDVESPSGEQVLYAKPPEEKPTPYDAMNTAELMRRYSATDWIPVRIQLHQRLARPLACIVLAMVGIPLGISTRKGGKSAGYIIAIFLGFFCYHLSSLSLVKVATARTLPIPVAIWLPDVAFFVAGLVFLSRMERPGDRDLLTGLRAAFARLYERIKSSLDRPKAGGERLMGWRMPLLPQIVDTYVLSNFLFYFTVVLASFVSMTEVYVFFELLADYIKNHIAMVTMFTYLFFLIPELIYRLAPVSVLVAVLINFSIMTKNNEVTAFKACGISLFRLGLPILIAAMLFSGGLFAFDFYYVPEANRKQDALRDVIRNRPIQTYLRPDRKWIMAQGSRIYYYNYFDGQRMAAPNVFDVDPNTFKLNRQVLAENAEWSPSAQTWIVTNGWIRDFRPTKPTYEEFKVKPLPDLTEPPGYFLTEALQEKQMNFRELDQYIRGLEQRGYDVVRLQVQYYRKFSVPLFALIMALISVPFGFLVGTRGAMTGIGVSLAIGVAYLGLEPLFTEMGNLNQLSPAVAAWSPDVLFLLTGLYLLLRMRS